MSIIYCKPSKFDFVCKLGLVHKKIADEIFCSTEHREKQIGRSILVFCIPFEQTTVMVGKTNLQNINLEAEFPGLVEISVNICIVKSC